MSHAISNPHNCGHHLLTGNRNRMSRFQAVEYDGRFFVNPGSATGAWTGLWNGCVFTWSGEGRRHICKRHSPEFLREPTPSFALMDIQGPVVVTYVYQLIDGEVRVEKIEYRKDADNFKEPARTAASPQNIPSSPSAAQQQQNVW